MLYSKYKGYLSMVIYLHFFKFKETHPHCRSLGFFNEKKMNLLNDQGGTTVDVLKVSATSNPNSVAGALAGILRERGRAEMQAIGAGAINQAVKAIAIARGFVAPSGVNLVCIPAFTDITIDGEERTAIKLIVQPLE
jgi:stage V sporulation protein S